MDDTNDAELDVVSDSDNVLPDEDVMTDTDPEREPEPVYDVMACTGPAPSGLALRYTYDQAPNLSGGTLEQQGSETWSLTTIPSARFGTTAGRSELRYGDEEAYGGPRAELAVVGNSNSRYEAGSEAYYGFSVRLMPNWVNDGAIEDIMFQWHSAPDTSLGEQSHSPNVYLGIKRDEWILRITSDSNAVSTNDSVLKEQVVLVADLDYSQTPWHDFVFHIRWANTGTTGLIEVWHKLADEPGYTKVLTKTGPNMHNDLTDGFVKWGIYKPAWRSAATAASKRIVDHDEVRVGPSFGFVEPGCQR